MLSLEDISRAWCFERMKMDEVTSFALDQDEEISKEYYNCWSCVHRMADYQFWYEHPEESDFEKYYKDQTLNEDFIRKAHAKEIEKMNEFWNNYNARF